MGGASPQETRAHLAGTTRLTAELADAFAMKRAALALYPIADDFLPESEMYGLLYG